MKKSLVALMVLVGALVGALLFGAVTAQSAANLNCTGAVVGGTYNNVTVPAGAHCSLDGTRVLGSVTVQTNASLDTSQTSGDTTVAGNVNGKNCAYIDLESPSNAHRTAIGGDLNITNCNDGAFNGARGGSSAGPPPNMLIGGKVNCSGNPSGCVFDYTVIGKDLTCNGNGDCDLESDAVGGNVTINNNGGGGFVFNGIIGGNLSCSGNTGLVGTGNTVAGNETGQCTGF
jgi:hypothetical protein